MNSTMYSMLRNWEHCLFSTLEFLNSCPDCIPAVQTENSDDESDDEPSDSGNEPSGPKGSQTGGSGAAAAERQGSGSSSGAEGKSLFQELEEEWVSQQRDAAAAASDGITTVLAKEAAESYRERKESNAKLTKEVKKL